MGRTPAAPGSAKIIFVLVLFFVTAVIAPCRVGMAQSAERRDGGIDQESSDRDASRVLQKFQSYWSRGDVGGLLSLLSDGGRVIMRVEFLGLNGIYEKGQAGYIMKEFFGRGKADRFSLSRYRELSGGVSAYAAGDISYHDKRSGLERALRIFISLEERGGKWFIDEIRINDG